ncbi:1bbde2fe-efc3-4c69-941a-75a91a7cd454 [Sclerotinia trifoliorum]|uniref:1bbde2fe-efc3-4c69-941a-75a91a7cd454 n=1 Tax=Sclerotinia trifoliorum TaxID=28548 RepID=A0A8H2VR03_9HELO|nr:1bbde2fe-efc3-4c69-941a-75a91a7cd454 [Sclerotinia trifoliorum]
MAALHDALKALGAINYDETPTDNLKPFLLDAFSSGQTIVDSIPVPDTAEPSSGRPRSNTTPLIASSASEILASHARSPPPPHDIESLQKEWKQVKLKPADNPLGISVYSCKGRDGKGTWFARRSVHEGLGFTKWKRGLEREFPETLKVQGGPGEGNIRGIGGEKRVAYNNIPGTGKMEVYLLSAQFPGPTSPRDFVTMLISSDQALKGQNDHEVPRHFMVISKPCQHPDAPQREGYIRGNYESVEFIREIPTKKAPPKRSVSASDLTKGHSRDRSGSDLGREAVLRNAHQKHDQSTTEEGEGIEGQASRSDSNLALVSNHENTAAPNEDDEWEQNPIEWIMITRSDPGGSVPRFMIDRGTPSAIVSDAGKFLDWACSKTIEELDSDDEEPVEKEEENAESEHHYRHHRQHGHEKDLHNYQTNGHLAGIDSQAEISPSVPLGPTKPPTQTQQQAPVSGGGIYDLVAGVATSAGAFIAPYAPAIIADRLPHASEALPAQESEPFPLASEPVPTQFPAPIPRSRSVSDASITSESTVNSFESALSFRKISSQDSAAVQKVHLQQDKELQKLEDKKRKLQEKLERAKQREADKKSEDGEKEKKDSKAEENMREK